MSSQGIYIIAEAGVNHNGSIDLAKRLINSAVEAGANAVKFQTFKAEKIVSRSAPKAPYQINNMGAQESQLEMLQKLELDDQAHKELMQYCQEQNIDFLSSPFDQESVDLLANKLDIKRFKIPSGEITNAPFLLHIAHTNKPVILSTGMSTLEEIRIALGVLAFGFLQPQQPPSFEAFTKVFDSSKGQRVLKEKVVLLHCTSEYPSPFNEVNLRAIETLRKSFLLPVGFSDHTLGISIPIAAAALGACMIEKHFTLDRNLSGPDHQASLEPLELSQMIRSIREVEMALGSSEKKPTSSELKNRPIARKSLVASCKIHRGEIFHERNLGIKRPGHGISPLEYWNWIGKKATRDYIKDEIIDL